MAFMCFYAFSVEFILQTGKTFCTLIPSFIIKVDFSPLVSNPRMFKYKKKRRRCGKKK